MRIETRIDRSGPVERAYEQASGDDEDDAEGDLADDKGMPQAQAADARSVVSQARQDIGLRRVNRWRQSRQQRRHKGECRSKGDDAAIKRER